jgi:hypothetical protein
MLHLFSQGPADLTEALKVLDLLSPMPMNTTKLFGKPTDTISLKQSWIRGALLMLNLRISQNAME